MNRFWTTFVAALGCLLLLALIGGTYIVMNDEVSMGVINTLKNGRTITGLSDERAGFSVPNSYDTATIETAHHVIVVAPKELIVDDQQVAQFEEKVRSISITLQKGKLTFDADGKRVNTLLR